jgi:hypothetical protein
MKIQLKTAVLALALAGLTIAASARPAMAGLNAMNGLNSINGLATTNGLSTTNGLNSINGLTTGVPHAIVGIWAASGISPARPLAQSLSARAGK